MIDLQKLRDLASILAPLQELAADAERLNNVTAATEAEVARAKFAVQQAREADLAADEAKKIAKDLHESSTREARDLLAKAHAEAAQVLAKAKEGAAKELAAAEKAGQALVQSAKTEHAAVNAEVLKAKEAKALLEKDVLALEARLAAAQAAARKALEG